MRGRTAVVPLLVALALVAFGVSRADASEVYECTEFELIGDPARVVTPWPSPTRNAGSTLGIVLQLDPYGDRRGYTLTVRDDAGAVVIKTSKLTGNHNTGLYWANVELGAAEPRTFTLTFKEMWKSVLGGSCTTTTERTFVAGGPEMDLGPRPPLRVRSTLNGRASGRVAGWARQNSPFAPRISFKITTRCRVLDDGLGNGVLAPRQVFIAWPRGAGAMSYWDPCRMGPTSRPIGSSWVKSTTVSRRLSVGVGSKHSSQRMWRVGMSAWPVNRDGRVDVRRSNYRPETWKRIYSSNFDAYWNICVKGPREVWASGGQVYCTIRSALARAHVTMRLVG